jgi:hypothetical protein
MSIWLLLGLYLSIMFYPDGGTMKIKIILVTMILFLLGNTFVASYETKDVKNYEEKPGVTININSHETLYEGDIINCTITGNPTFVYWSINNQSKHTTFYGDDPVIFDSEPTPLGTDYVNLTVYAENSAGNDSDTIEVSIKRIYFGDIHWHSILSDGDFSLATNYENIKKDNYLDFACSSDHAELFMCDNKLLFPFAWLRIKNLVKSEYVPGEFTTFLAYEYSGTTRNIGNIKLPLVGYTSHINFYYKDVYQGAARYPSKIKRIYDTILSAMSREWDAGHYNIGFFHHPLAGNMRLSKYFDIDVANYNFHVNWTIIVDKMKEENFRNNFLKIIRGVETYSRWGTAIGNYSNIPVSWQYNQSIIYDDPDSWVENALWEWSESNYTKGHPFVLIASSDTHHFDRPCSADISKEESYYNLQNPCGIIAAYSIHNTRDEIWDAMNNCNVYGTQLLKIRANVRVGGQMALGQWINCKSPLIINITAMSTFSGLDNGCKNMSPYNYSSEELDHPIQDIWLLKKDRERGRPWCKIIGHATPNEHLTVVTFNDTDVQPNDFYWVAIRQKGQELRPSQNEYMAFIGPVFINNVV